MSERYSMKRLAIAAFLVLSALGLSNTHVAAAGLPRPTHAVNTNDYSFYAETCTPGAIETCGDIYAYNDSSAQVGPPTGGYIECERYFSSGYQATWLMIGQNSYGGEYGTGNVGGVAGVLGGSAIYSNLTGSGNTIFDNGASGSVTGSAFGIVKFDPNSDNITSGKITITIRGAIENYSYSTDTYTMSYGTMTCSIAPNSYDSYVEFFG
jgi:hypothetical protein